MDDLGRTIKLMEVTVVLTDDDVKTLQNELDTLKTTLGLKEMASRYPWLVGLRHRLKSREKNDG